MYVSASKNQAKSVSGMTKQQTAGYEELQKAIADFTLNSPFLTGKAYDTSKAFFSTVLYPLAQGGILLSEAVDKAVTKFPQDYQSQVDSGNLKQSDLEEKIRQADRLIGQAEGIRTMLESSLTPDIIKSSQLAANLRLLESYSGVKRILEEKLDKLMTFNYNSPRIFEEIQALEDAIDQGLAQTTTAFNPATGTFTIPSKGALSWSKTITEKWKAKEQEQADLDIKKTNDEKNTFEKDIKGRTYKFVEVHGARMWLWVKDPAKVTQDDIEFNERYRLFFDGKAEKYGIKNVHKKEQQNDWLTTISHELSTGINAITGRPLNAIEKFQRWDVLVSTFSTSLVGAYWTVKLSTPVKATPKVIDDITNPVLESPRSGSALKIDNSNPVKEKGSIYTIDPITGEVSTKQNSIIVNEFPNIPKAHGFSDIVDNYAGFSQVTDLGNAKLYQVQGSQNGVLGRFEWIIQDGKVTHRMFVRNPELNGVPIK